MSALSVPFTGISSIFEKKDKWNKGINKFYYEKDEYTSGGLHYIFKQESLKFLIIYGNFNKNNYLLLDDDKIYTISNIRHMKSILDGKYIEFEII